METWKAAIWAMLLMEEKEHDTLLLDIYGLH